MSIFETFLTLQVSYSSVGYQGDRGDTLIEDGVRDLVPAPREKAFRLNMSIPSTGLRYSEQRIVEFSQPQTDD